MKTTLMTFSFTLFLAALATTSIANEPFHSPTVTNKAVPTPTVRRHCEVPCGIYTDQLRFEQMLEDTATIAKAITNINEFADGLGANPATGKSINQVTRWVSTKENHATNIQHIVSQYFLTQRIKSDHKDYTGQLATAHRVMVAAMKCKQDADAATAETLKKAILDLYRAYEGKEPGAELHGEKK